jgi:predicted acylesterase/phospholipase RssA
MKTHYGTPSVAASATQTEFIEDSLPHAPISAQSDQEVDGMSVRGASAGNGRQKTADLVFQGGSVKGIGLVGAYSVLEERGYRPVNMAGASAGAIVAALVAAA